MCSISVHERILSATSQFFKAAVKKEWTKALPREIQLSDEDPATFRTYVTWLYCHRLATSAANPSDETNDRTWKLLTKCYLLGEKLIDAKFKDSVIDAMLATMRSRSGGRSTLNPGTQAIKTLYEGTPKGSKARRLFAESCAGNIQLSTFTANKECYPQDFLLDLAEALIAKRPVDTSA